MAEQAHETLTNAALRLEELAGRATPGPWEGVVDDHGRKGIDASVWADSSNYYVTEHISSGAQYEQADAHWIAAMSPVVAAPLVAWLKAEARFVRRNAQYMGGMEQELPSLRFARLILEEAKP